MIFLGTAAIALFSGIGYMAFHTHADAGDRRRGGAGLLRPC
jgi:hypothetical protein